MTPRRDVAEDARCIVYTRVSTTKQAAPEKASLDDQLARCRALAASLGHPSPALWEDPGKSGTDPARLDALVEWCEARPGDGLVVVYSPDRFARIGSEVVGYYTVRLRKAGWDLRYVDLARTGNQLVDGVGGSLRAELAAEESRIKRERSLIGGPKVAADGRWNGGNAPLGYAVGPDKRLVPGDAAAVKAVKKAFAMYAGGETLESVGRAIGRGPSGARHVLANPVYVGTVEYGRRKGSKARKSGKEKAHAALVDADTWARVQDRLRSPNPRFAHGAKGPAPRGSLPYVLSRVARCTCRPGQFLVGGGGVPAKSTEAQRLRLRGYQCKACRGRVQQAAFEAAVYRVVTDFLREDDEAGRLERRAAKWVATRLAEGGADAIEREKKDLEARKARLIRTAEETDDPAVSARIREVNERLRQLDAAGRARPDARAVKAEAARVLANTRAVVARAAKGGEIPPSEANTGLARLRPLIAEVTWDRETRQVEVNLRPFTGTGVATVPTSRESHSGSSVPSRATRGVSPQSHSGYSAPCRADDGVESVTVTTRVWARRRRRKAA